MQHYIFFLITVIIIIIAIIVFVRYSKDTFSDTDAIIAKKLINFILENEPTYKQYVDFLINSGNTSVNIVKYSSFKKLKNIPKISEQDILNLLYQND